MTLGELLEHFQTVLHHTDVDSGHELLPDAAHGKGTRGKLVTGIAFDDKDAAFKAVLKKVESNTRADNSGANNENVGWSPHSLSKNSFTTCFTSLCSPSTA